MKVQTKDCFMELNLMKMGNVCIVVVLVRMIVVL